jgi:hypothetical protein
VKLTPVVVKLFLHATPKWDIRMRLYFRCYTNMESFFQLAESPAGNNGTWGIWGPECQLCKIRLL